MSAPATAEPARRAALSLSVEALRRVAAYALSPELDRRILDLGERNDTLTPRNAPNCWRGWRSHKSARSSARGAEPALRRLAEVFPELAERP
jgi:hypothetical protein